MNIKQVAAQLYTVRDLCKTAADLAATAAKIRAIGYPAVQVSGIGPIPYAEARRIFEGEGLVVCASHEPSAMIRKEPERVVERLKELGTTQTAYPYPADVDFANPEHVSALIDDLARAGEVLSRAGLVLSYHNHAIEFLRSGDGTLLDLIYARTNPRFLQAEIDTYWVQFGGGNPVEWCRKLAGRLPLLHMKDYGYTPANKPVFAEIGNGNLDFPAIVAAAEQSGCQWFIVEQDTCPGDPIESLRQSFSFIRDRLASA
jgi:sugar phosphate isomerase/epimerase